MSAGLKKIDFPDIKLTALCKLIDINAAWTHGSQHLNCKNHGPKSTEHYQCAISHPRAQFV